MDWAPVRAKIAQHGMRNSNVLAIAPTATISNITATSPCIEPTYKNLFVKSNLSGEFIVLNPFLVKDLKARGLWDQDMIDNLKYFDGELKDIERIPADLKASISPRSTSTRSGSSTPRRAGRSGLIRASR